MKKIGLFFLCLGWGIFSLQAEEGMWCFDQIPKEKIQAQYGIQINGELLEHIQKCSLRVSAGGSGSFISSKGLVMTNHHVGASAIYNLSSKDQDYLEKGFYAKSLGEELHCPNLYVDQLVAISDVTEEVNRKMEKGLSFVEKERIRKEAILEIQQEAEKKSGLHPEVVMLYEGARYHLYLYKRYTDLRLVMAPEKQVAFLGGDIDNFEYPRHNLDVCFFRVYENGQPLEIEHYLKWSETGPLEGELLFVSGHPGKTKRMWTADHLRYLERVELPMILQYLEERMAMLDLFSLKSSEHARIAASQKHSLSNAYKVYKGVEKGFIENSPIPKKEQQEALLYNNKETDLYLAWDSLKEALSKSESYIASYYCLEGIFSNYSKLYGIAKSLVRLSEEKKLPSEKRLPEYSDTEIDKLRLRILSSEPIYLELEIACLSDSLQRLQTILGKESPLVESLLQGRTPEEVAKKAIENTRLKDLEEREALFDSLEIVAFSKDPLISLVKTIDLYARAVRKEKEEKLDAIQNESYSFIGNQRFNQYGDLLYPDATFTLRLSYGCMKGYEEGGNYLEAKTTFADMQRVSELHPDESAYYLPEKWKNIEKLDKTVGLNFVSTHDIIGGNSGSPVVNAKGEWVGLVFDGNVHSLTWGQVFDEKQGRAISVHGQGIIEVLEKIYEVESLVEEIKGI